MSIKYKEEEIKRHDNNDDLWIVLHGKVYNLTKFLKEHPGGEEVLVNLAGKDGTTCFDDVGHSEEAKLLKDSYQIGELEGDLSNSEEASSKKGPAEIDDDKWTYEEPKKDSSNIFYACIALAVVAYAVIFYYMFY